MAPTFFLIQIPGGKAASEILLQPGFLHLPDLWMPCGAHSTQGFELFARTGVISEVMLVSDFKLELGTDCLPMALMSVKSVLGPLSILLSSIRLVQTSSCILVLWL